MLAEMQQILAEKQRPVKSRASSPPWPGPMPSRHSAGSPSPVRPMPPPLVPPVFRRRSPSWRTCPSVARSPRTSRSSSASRSGSCSTAAAEASIGYSLPSRATPSPSTTSATAPRGRSRARVTDLRSPAGPSLSVAPDHQPKHPSESPPPARSPAPPRPAVLSPACPRRAAEPARLPHGAPSPSSSALHLAAFARVPTASGPCPP